MNKYKQTLLKIYCGALAVVSIATAVVIYLIITTTVNFAESWKEPPTLQGIAPVLPLIVLWLVPMARLVYWAERKPWRWYVVGSAFCALLASIAIGSLVAVAELSDQANQAASQERIIVFQNHFVLIVSLLSGAVLLLLLQIFLCLTIALAKRSGKGQPVLTKN